MTVFHLVLEIMLQWKSIWNFSKCCCFYVCLIVDKMRRNNQKEGLKSSEVHERFNCRSSACGKLNIQLNKLKY